MTHASLALIMAMTAAPLMMAATAPVAWPPGDTQPLRAFALERDGTGWALLANRSPMYYAGNAFHQLTDGPPPGDTYDLRFLGNATHGYYLQRHDRAPLVKRIYRLIDGAAQQHCEPLFTASDDQEMSGNTYVAHDGRVVSWSDQRLALWFRDRWTFSPVPIPYSPYLPVVLEHAGHIFIIDAQTFHVIDPEGGVSTRRPAWKNTTRGCFHWQGTLALRQVAEAADIEAFDLLSGEVRPLPPPLVSVPEPIETLHRSSTGTRWAKTAKAVYRFNEAGQIARFDLPTEAVSIVAIAEDGTVEVEGGSGWDIFFTDSRRPGLWRWNAEGTEQWDTRHGIKGSIQQATLTADRTLWFFSVTMDAWSLFRLPLDPPRTPLEAEPERWTLIDIYPGTRPMDLGGTMACIPAEGNRLQRWDGVAWTNQPWPNVSEQSAFVNTAWDDRGTVYLRHPYGGTAISEFTPTAVTVIADSKTPDHHMLRALQRSAERGATRFSFGYEERFAVISPEKQIWMIASDSSIVRHYDGMLWREIPVEGSPASLTWSLRDGVVLHLHGGGTQVYTNGFFERRTEATSGAPPARPAVFAGLAETPLADRPVYDRFADAAGNLWFWLKQENRACCFRLDDLRLTARADPLDTQPGSLKILASVIPACQTVRYAYRLDDGQEWQPLLTQQGALRRLSFATSGVYTCEVAAVVCDVRLPRTATFSHTIRVALPETRHLARQNEPSPLLVTEPGWYPPVEMVPTFYASRSVCEIVWREADSSAPWRPLEPNGRFPLHRLETNGFYRIEFAAREEQIRFDPSPVVLTLRLALDDEGMLLLTLDNLASDDPGAQRRAEARLLANQARWTPLLQRLQEQARGAGARLDSLERLNETLRQNGL